MATDMTLKETRPTMLECMADARLFAIEYHHQGIAFEEQCDRNYEEILSEDQCERLIAELQACLDHWRENRPPAPQVSQSSNKIAQPSAKLESRGTIHVYRKEVPGFPFVRITIGILIIIGLIGLFS